MTQPTGIYQSDNLLSNHGERSIRLGWQRASGITKGLCCLSVCVVLGAVGWQLWQGELASLSLLSVAALWVWYFRWHGVPLAHPPASLLKLCHLRQGRCYIGGQLLPANLQQVALGVTDSGQAYLQLAWNGGWQWLFDSRELPAVRSWLLQHYPALQIVS